MPPFRLIGKGAPADKAEDRNASPPAELHVHRSPTIAGVPVSLPYGDVTAKERLLARQEVAPQSLWPCGAQVEW